MSLFSNNITIYPISGYSPSFTWQVGLQEIDSISSPLQFRATIRPIHGLEDYTRVPSTTVLYEETGIYINDSSHLGQWGFPLEVNALLTGGPYRDYQVVIEAHDSDGNTSAGNRVQTYNEDGWTQYGNGYDIIAIQNTRQTGIELSNNLPTQNTIEDFNFYINSGHGYSSLNYMGSNGEINIRYLSGLFNSNIVGGYIYTWTGQFPKKEALLRVSGYGGVSKSQFSFNPSLGYVYHPTAGMQFRGANYVYTSVSFYDNLDKIAIDNGIDISTGLYLSDNAICYNDAAVGSLTIGGFHTIYSMQYTGEDSATGILGTGITTISERNSEGNTSVLYLSEPNNVIGFAPFTGTASNIAGGLGGKSLLNDNILFCGGVPVITSMYPSSIPEFTTDFYINIFGNNLTEISGPDGYGIVLLINGYTTACTWGVTSVSPSQAVIHIQPIPTVSSTSVNELIWLNNYNTIATARRFRLNVV